MSGRVRSTGITTLNLTVKTKLQTIQPFRWWLSLASSKLQLVYNPTWVGTKASHIERVTFKHKHRLLSRNSPRCSEYDINEVHQVFSIKTLDMKVVNCPRQRHFYSSVSKLSAATKRLTSQPASQTCLLDRNVFNVGKFTNWSMYLSCTSG